MHKIILIILSFIISLSLMAECEINTTRGALNDPLFLLLKAQSQCPAHVSTLKTALENAGLSVNPAMVANRGRHNPVLGSFSFFEEVTGASHQLPKLIERGEFFFGHFTSLNGNIIELDQSPDPDPEEQKLLIEAIAWDSLKGMFNFYELISQGSSTLWYYRGDSQTALDDNRYLFLDPPEGEDKFGNRMRCSACHASGGPIMKELAAPHNDWWTSARPLLLGSNRPSAPVASYLSRIMDASTFSQSVQAGMKRLEESETYQQAKNNRSLQEQLRPVFCATEINIASDMSELSSTNRNIIIPSAYILSPWLGNGSLLLNKYLYLGLLEQNRIYFPETSRIDADHAWLSLVKSEADHLAIRTLIDKNLVSEEWVKAVMAVDFSKPTISLGRCQLLKLVPENYSENWQEQFLAQLQNSALPFAHELAENLKQPIDYEELAWDFFVNINQQLTTTIGREQLFAKLIFNRAIIGRTDLVKNPRGQILEPGFRVIFPRKRD